MARDDERRPGSGGSPSGDDPFAWAKVTIPDDLSELDPDVRAYRRERRARSRREWAWRYLLWRRNGMPGALILAIVLTLGGFITVVVYLPPPNQAAVDSDPLAAPEFAVGEEGGLLPDTQVRSGDGGVQPLRALRPAVVAVLPADCACADELRRLVSSADRHRITSVLVGPETPAAPAGAPTTNLVRGVEEPSGDVGDDSSLVTRYHVTDEPVLLMVRSDGVLNRIIDDIPGDRALDGELVVLDGSGS